MKNFVGIMILLVVSMFAYGNASPPDDVGYLNIEQVLTADADHFVINVPTIEADVYTFEQREMAQLKLLPDKDAEFVMVREVTTCRKISTPKAESGAAIENAELALTSACTDINNVTQSPPLLCSARVATNNNPTINLQHTNYGYPLIAN
jgi:hypothetical protein